MSFSFDKRALSNNDNASLTDPSEILTINLRAESDILPFSKSWIFLMWLKSFSNLTNNNCRVYIRPSGTEPVLRILVEAQNQKEVNSLSNRITSELITKINKISDNLWIKFWYKCFHKF